MHPLKYVFFLPMRKLRRRLFSRHHVLFCKVFYFFSINNYTCRLPINVNDNFIRPSLLPTLHMNRFMTPAKEKKERKRIIVVFFLSLLREKKANSPTVTTVCTFLSHIFNLFATSTQSL